VSNEAVQVSIRILDKEYRIACEPREQDGLRESARLLDGKMREIRKTGRVIGTDRIAVMAALNIAHDLFQLQRASRSIDGGERRSVSRCCRIESSRPWRAKRRWTRRMKGYSLLSKTSPAVLDRGLGIFLSLIAAPGAWKRGRCASPPSSGKPEAEPSAPT
jgi:cell division protein ZapA